jgi:hypothetical protein
MKKAAVIALLLLILVFWGEAVFELLLHAVEIVLEVLELLMDELLEGVLHLAPHDAQAVTAWLGFGVFSLLLYFGFRKLRRGWVRMKLATPAWWEEEKARLAAMKSSLGWPAVLIALVLLLVLIYL